MVKSRGLKDLVKNVGDIRPSLLKRLNLQDEKKQEVLTKEEEEEPFIQISSTQQQQHEEEAVVAAAQGVIVSVLDVGMGFGNTLRDIAELFPAEFSRQNPKPNQPQLKLYGMNIKKYKTQWLWEGALFGDAGVSIYLSIYPLCALCLHCIHIMYIYIYIAYVARLYVYLTKFLLSFLFLYLRVIKLKPVHIHTRHDA